MVATKSMQAAWADLLCSDEAERDRILDAAEAHDLALEADGNEAVHVGAMVPIKLERQLDGSYQVNSAGS